MATTSSYAGISKEVAVDAYASTKKRLANLMKRSQEQTARVTEVAGNVAGGLAAGIADAKLMDKKTGKPKAIMGAGIPLVAGSVAAGIGLMRQAGKASDITMSLGAGMLAYGLGNIARERVVANDRAKAASRASGGGAVPAVSPPQAGGGSAVVMGAPPYQHAPVVGYAPPPRAIPRARELTLDDLQRQWANLRAAYE